MNSKPAAVLATGVAITIPALTAGQTPATRQSAQTTLVLTGADTSGFASARPAWHRMSTPPLSCRRLRGWVMGTADTGGLLRQERYSVDRVYTLTYQGSDNAGNTATCQAIVTIKK